MRSPILQRRAAAHNSLLCAMTAAGALGTAPALAQLPLSIEELLVDASVLKLSTQANAFQAYQPRLMLRRDSAGEAPRLDIGQRRLQGVSRAMMLRYGLSSRLELNLTAADSELRWRDPQGAGGRWQQQRYSVGSSWLARSEDRWPALMLDLGLELAQRDNLSAQRTQWLPGYTVGVTAFSALDPLVLSVAVRYRQQRLAPGAAAAGSGWSVLPQVNFAVNPQVTLIGGLSLNSSAGQRDAPAVPAFNSSLRLGLGYAPGPQHTVFLQTDISTAGGESSGLSMEWLYRF